MQINDKNYRLTKHGRKRFVERVRHATDSEIIRQAENGIPGFRFIWKPDHREGYRLITVLNGGNDNDG